MTKIVVSGSLDRKFIDPLPGSYWDRVQRGPRNASLQHALALLDRALYMRSQSHRRALIQEAMGAIRESEDTQHCALVALSDWVACSK